MTLVSALLIKNEADRYLRRVLARCAEFSDQILVLDDGSTDDTVAVAEAAGCLVKQRPRTGMWGNEAPARAELWERGAKLAKDDWLLICDADMILEGDPRDLIQTWEVSIWAFVLYDCWDGEHQARVDGPWQHGPLVPRPWLFRPSVCVDGAPQWNGRGLHCGHAPQNLTGLVAVAPPDTYFWRHLSYVKSEDRLRKHAQYMEKAHLLTEFERRHSASIIDA